MGILIAIFVILILIGIIGTPILGLAAIILAGWGVYTGFSLLIASLTNLKLSFTDEFDPSEFFEAMQFLCFAIFLLIVCGGFIIAILASL